MPGQRHNPYLRLVCLWLALTGCLLAQDVGGIRGTVVDADFNETVPGVTVVAEGPAQNGALTDADGRFFINNLPPGIYRLSFSKEGYARARLESVSVSAGSIREVRSEIVSNVEELDEITMSIEDVVGSDPQTAALGALKQDLGTIASNLGARFIANIGGSNISSAVKKLTGVSTTGGGKYVVIRGLADRYNVVTLNGARIPSSDPDKRAVNIDIFPSKLIADITSAKTFTPEIPGEATGGYIDLRTLSIPKEDFADFSLSYSYNTEATSNPEFLTYRGAGTGWFGTLDQRRLPALIRQRNFQQLTASTENMPVLDEVVRLVSPYMGTERRAPPQDHSMSLIVGKRLDWGSYPAGITAGFTHSKKYSFQDDAISRRYSINDGGGVDHLRDQTVDRGSESLLTGGLLSLGVETGEESQIALTFFYNLAAEDRAVLALGDDISFDTPPGEGSPRSTSIQESLHYTERTLATLQLAGRHKIEGANHAEIDWVLSGSRSSQDEPDLRFHGSVIDEAFGRVYLLTFSPFGVPPYFRFWRELEDWNYNAALNIKYPLFEGSDGEESFVRFGAAFDRTTRDFRADTLAYTPGVLADGTSGNIYIPTGNETFASVFLDPSRNVPPSQGGLTLNRAEEIATYSAEQNIFAFYGAVKADMTDELSFMVGARVEGTDIRVKGPTDPELLRPFLTNPITGKPRKNPARSEISQTDFLPALTIDWEFAEDMRLILAASRTVARPSFKELPAISLFDADRREYFMGNPDLQMSASTNIDVRWQYEPTPDALFALTGFTKDIDRPIELVSQGRNLFFYNSPSAQVYGFEIEGRYNLGALAEDFRHFSIGANYTLIQSRTSLDPLVLESRKLAGFPGTTRRLQGQPDYILNFDLSYDEPDWGLNAGIYLNVVGSNLIRTSGDRFTPEVFEAPYSTLDFVISKKFADDWKLTFRAQNLLSATLFRYYDSPSKLTFEEVETGPTYQIGLSKSW